MSYPPNDSYNQGGQPQFQEQNPYAQQTNPHGGYPNMPGYGEALPGGEEPKESKQLKQATWLSAGIYIVQAIIGVLATVIFSDVIRDQVLDEVGSQASAEEADDLASMSVTVGIAAAVLFLVVALVVYFIVILGLRGNANWGRITGLVFAIIGTLSTLGSLATAFTDGFALWMTILNVLLGLGFVAVNIWWIVLCFKAPVARWYKSKGGTIQNPMV